MNIRGKSTVVVVFGYILLTAVTGAFLFGAQTEPPGLKWKKIVTPHFRIIFPAEITRGAQRAANTLEHLYGPICKSLETEFKPMTLVLSNQSTEANGYVQSGPVMSEWYARPMNNYTDWYTTLAIHEGRHMAQYAKLDQGFTHLARIVMGDTGLNLKEAAAPRWLMEGDAVLMETLLTHGGRGRLPSFDMAIRTQLLSGIRFNYSRAYLGSYNGISFSRYALGYLLTTHARRNHGANLWSRVMDRASKYTFLPWTFSDALQKETGSGTATFYRGALDQLEQLWKQQQQGLTFTSYKTVNRRKKGENARVSYTFLQDAGDGSGAIIAKKTSLRHIPRLVRFHPGKNREETLCSLVPISPRVSVQKGLAAWDEKVPDPRWGKRSYAVIKIHNLSTGKTRTLTQKSRYYSPAISPDGKKTAVVNFDTGGQSTLVLLDIQTGRVVKRMPNPDNHLPAHPSWSPGGSHIVFTRLHNSGGQSLNIWDTRTGTVEDVLPPSWEFKSYPVYHDKYILYNSPYSGIDNIYALDTRTGSRFQVTGARFGAFFPEVSSGNTLLYSQYTADGYDAAQTPLTPSSWLPIEKVRDRNLGYFKPLAGQEAGPGISEPRQLPNKQYPVKNYRPRLHFFRFHSREIELDDPLVTLDFISNDYFDMMNIRAGVTYNIDEKTPRFHVTAAYNGLFPILEAGVSYGWRKQILRLQDGGTSSYSWRELSGLFGFRIPLDLSRGCYSTGLSLEAHLKPVRLYGLEGGMSHVGNAFTPLQYRAAFSRMRYMSIRDLAPCWGQALSLTYRHIPWKNQVNGATLTASGVFYFPGLLYNHSIKTSVGWEKNFQWDYAFSGLLPLPRGYTYGNGIEAYHNRLRFSADYAFPLLYADWAVGEVIYLKRLRANLFYDHTTGLDNGTETHFNSAGIELFGDFHLFNFSEELELGSRLSYRFTDRAWKIEFISVNLNL